MKQLEILHSVLRNLSSSADEQLEYLTALGMQNSIDEIALEFDDIVGPFVADLKLPEAVRNKLRSIDERLNKMSDHKDLWTPAALKSRQEWTEIRSVARRALDDLSTKRL
ncbi:MAG: hypothetical protein LGR52_04775 [Candidatus Thiosymbion ectosymbiont of Robbea hypermnestra]|nr:hypothetical protein [Candidatus Thiosymbion ectosymbiont of Robbea hypermnestra]